MNHKEILNKLPSNWQELKLKDYIKLAPAINDDDSAMVDPDYWTKQYLTDLEKNIQIISLLTDTAVEVIEAFTMAQLDELVTKVSFLNEAPKSPKTSVKYKEFNQLSYDNFITFQKLQTDFTPDKILTSAIHNLPMMLSVFSKDSLSEDYFLNLSMPEIIAGFFLLTRNIEKYLRHLKASSLKQLMNIQVNQIKNLLIFWWQKVRTSKKSLT